MDEKARVLIVNGELATRVNLQMILAKEDYDVQAVASGQEALQILAKSPVDVILIEPRLDGPDNLSVLTEAKRLSRETTAIIITGHSSFESAREAVHHGVYDYLGKLYTPEALKLTLRRAVEHKWLNARLQELSVLQELKASEERYRTFVESVSDPILSMDAQGALTFVNRALRSVMGYQVEEVVGRNYLDFIAPEDRAKAAESFARLLKGDETIRDVVVTVLNQAGEREVLGISAYPLWRDGQIVGITGLVRDITERNRALEREQRKARQSSAIHEISRQIAATLDLDTLIEQVSARLRQSFGYDVVLVFLMHRQENQLVVKEGAIGYAGRALIGHSLKIGEGIVGWVAQTGETLLANDVSQEPRFHYTAQLSETRAELAIPLKVRGQVIGVLDIESARLNAFGPDDVMLLESLASEVAVAIENARLFEAERGQAEEMAALVEMNRTITEDIGLKETLDRILSSARKIIPVSECSVVLVDEVSGDLVVEASTDGEIGLRLNPAAPSGVGWVVKTKQILAEEEPSANPLFDQQLVQRYTIKSALIVPIIFNDKALGTLGFSECRGRRAFSDGEKMIAQAFAHQAAIAIQNARLYEERNRKVRQLDALNRIAASITSTLDLERVLNLIMQELQDLLHVEVCSLMLLDEQTNELVFQVSLGPGAEQAKRLCLSLNQGIAGWVAREGQPALVPDVRTDPRWYPQVDASTGFTTKSILALPLKSKEKVIGVIEAINKVEGNFTADDLQLLSSISIAAATAVENARLFSELNQAYREIAESRTQILESRNTLRALFDGITDNICIVDREFQIKAVNWAAAARFGEEPHSLIGKRCYEIFFQSDHSCDRCPVAETFCTGQSISATQGCTAGPETTRQWEMRTYPMRNAEQVIDQVIYIARDVSEKRRMEASLLQSARLSAVGELAAGVAHEISNPLTAIIGNAQMLLRALGPSDPHYEMAHLIERAGLRANKVVRDLLNFSRREEYRFAPTDINPSIQEALALVSAQLEQSHVRVTQSLASNLPPITASASHLQTVWTNLLLNAKDAMVEGRAGRIRIVTRYDRAKRLVRVLVADNGSGIAESALPRIFEPFFTTKPRGKGAGLGLYVSHMIVDQHRGTLQVQSKEGRGSTFIVTLPVESELPAATSAQ
jgi:two-component system NtrC family sensor kinase